MGMCPNDLGCPDPSKCYDQFACLYLSLSLSLPFTTGTRPHVSFYAARLRSPPCVTVPCRAPVRALGARSLPLRSFTVFVYGCRRPRDGARSADVRFAELCCADVARCTRWRCRRQPAHCTPPSSSVTPRCFEITVLKTSARWPARALLMKAPRSRSGLVVTGGTGLQFLNWSCRRQPFHRLAASPLSLHPKGGPRSIPALYYGNPSARVFLRGATPLATVCHGALPSDP